MVPAVLQIETNSFGQLKRRAVSSARVLVSVLEDDGAGVPAVQEAVRNTSAVLAELRMVAASLSDTD